MLRLKLDEKELKCKEAMMSYFVTNTGDVSLTASLLKSVKAGVAISATSLLIQT